MIVVAPHWVTGLSFFSLVVLEGVFLSFGSWALCFWSWKYFDQPWTKGSMPTYPSQKAAKADKVITAFCRQVMGLQVIVIQEVPEEVADQESEASLKVSDEDHTLICFCCRHSFAGR
jgi:hypothetical protein